MKFLTHRSLHVRIAASIFASIVRSATGLYRAKAVFSTPLGLAEFLALLTPFAIHFVIGKYSIKVGNTARPAAIMAGQTLVVNW